MATATTTRTDVYTRVTSHIVEELEQGVNHWRQNCIAASLSNKFFKIAPARGNPKWRLLEVRGSIFKLEHIDTHRACPLCNKFSVS